jgi:hypothetical protein
MLMCASTAAAAGADADAEARQAVRINRFVHMPGK